ETYSVSNGAGLILGGTNTGQVTVDGVRMHDVWDAIRPYPGTGGLVVKAVWLSYVRDDCVENDFMLPGGVDDSLFDGCHTAFSARWGGPNPPTTQGTAVWTIQNSLVRLEPMPYPDHWQTYGTPGHNTFFKWTSIELETTPSPRVRLIGNIFMAEQ